MANLISQNRKVLEESNYIRKTDPNQNYWFDFFKSKVTDYISRHGYNFNLILYGRPEKDNDFFVLPFNLFKHIFDDAYLRTDKRGQTRWVGTINFNELRISHCPIKPDISAYYGNASLLGIAPSSPPQVSTEELEQIRLQQEAEGAFAPANLEDARKHILAAIVLRQGQRTFRDQLLAAYRQSCAVTGCAVVETLEAAHIVAYRGPETNHVANGLLLRSDIHTLFDLGLLTVHPTDYRLLISRRLRGTAYEALDGQIIRLPTNRAEHPSREALELHLAVFQAKESESGLA